MALEGVDIAWARPSIAEIRAAGAHWVARYFSPDGSKNLTAAEVHDYPAAGLSIVTVFESTAGRATAGRAAGVADAQLAEQERRAVGLPSTHVHHFAVDLDATWASVKPYFDGVVSVIGLGRTGCYGGVHVIEGAHSYGLNYLWQTVAWSGGVWSPHATIRQTGATTLSGGADLDYAEVPDFGQYPRPAAPTPAPPANTPSLEDDVFEKDIKAGFGASETGAILDSTKCTVVSIPPQNGAYWGRVYASFGSDFGTAVLRVAIFGNTGWRISTIKVASAGPRVSIAILDGDQKFSVMRMPASATDKADKVPVSLLVEAFRR